MADEKRLYILSKNQDSTTPELLVYLPQLGIPSQGGRGEISSPVKRGSSLDKWIVHKYGKIKSVLPRSNKQINNNKNIFLKQQLNQRIKLHRQQQRTQQLTLHGNKIVHENLKEYGRPYSLSSHSNHS